jgi:serine protease Do
MRKPFFLVWLAVLIGGAAWAAAPRFVIDDDDYVDRVTHAGRKLMRQGKLVSSAGLRQQPRPRSVALQLAAPAQKEIAPPDLYERLRESTVAIGPLYRCPDCDDWHFNGSAGFVLNEDGVISTCCHVVLADDKDVKESYLIAADSTGRVFPVTAILAADTESDTCLLKIKGTRLKPLPLRAGVRPGEGIYCLSHPGGNHFMFSEGMVARVTRTRNERLEDVGKTNAALTRPILFLNVTAEYAPGSSGAPVADAMGNVVGQVVSIADAGEPAEDTPDGQLPASPSVPVRFCIAAEEILALTRPSGDEHASSLKEKHRSRTIP